MIDLSRRSLLLAGFVLAPLAACTSARAPGAVDKRLSLPNVSGPVPETPNSKSYRSAGGDDDALVAKYNYSRQEYFLEGATTLGPYKTRMVICRPKDPNKFTGIVCVEIFQTSIWLQVRDYLMRQGYGWAMISSRGNQWLGLLQRASPKRYGEVKIPADEINPEILQQAVSLLRTPKAPNPAGDLRVRKVLLTGFSGDGASTRMFIERAHKSVRLANGRPVFDGYFVCATAVGSAPSPIPDIDVPVLETMDENEMIRSFERGAGKLAYRREDGSLYRLWEIAGAGHITTRHLTRELEAQYAAQCNELPHSDIAMDHIYSNALDKLIGWVDRGPAPPHADRIAYEADGKTIKRDANGNAIGGVRSTAMDVPKATINVVSTVKAPGVRCEMVANMRPFTAQKMTTLYGSPEGYRKKVALRADQLVKTGFYLPHDAEEIKAEAAQVTW